MAESEEQAGRKELENPEIFYEPEDLDDVQELDWTMTIVNTSCLIYYTATLNFSKLLKDLRYVRQAFPSKISLSGLILKNVIQVFVLLKFVAHFFGLAAKVIAMLPILCNDHPQLLHPTILSQLIVNLFLPFIELALGYMAAEIIEHCMSRLPLFTICMVLRVAARLTILNFYLDFHSKINSDSLGAFRSIIQADEILLNQQILSEDK